ncbi:hypothetical protein VOLCADRAFT_89311 [Volvox carteri f. nagariensis]|uniref:Flavodoxin-like domain-containing protein n=1 Tax=Volvox carteri f. nagariensis TaxID=3068 RepID=D8TRD4_VOLCA|nr:uncharacterized protein VOLCADRAFT_89311 [Volvox carteri f. nagariensis]EFJ49873.1 hypothetical protein VOLCADRAFT_89311 [Volvox carteri f. nagariensis]|eukprot:XP_002948938.1 hypothetical protein VOLCADRAFT_89311 [Volvox carteri f. nagariensis]
MQSLQRQGITPVARPTLSRKAARAILGRSRAVKVLAVAAPAAPEVATAAVGDAPIKMSQVVMWSEGKRLQTQVEDGFIGASQGLRGPSTVVGLVLPTEGEGVLPIAEDTITIRSLDWDRDRFDIEFGLENGTTYNAYLIYGADKTALVDASHEKFHNLFLEVYHFVQLRGEGALQAELKAAGRSLDYIFVSHTEPDHSGLVPAVLDLHPEAVVCGSKVCISFLQNLTHRPFKAQAVKGGDKVDLGGGHVIEFVMAPNLHWPDTMFSFDHATGVMFTCDAFGMHYCSEQPFDADVKAILPHYRFYYDCLMKPNAKSVTTALRKVKDLPYTLIANGHGPLLRYNVSELVGDYGRWSAALGKGSTSVAVLYCSDYGFSDRLSQTLAKGITKAGVATDMIDLLSVDPQELVAVVGRSAGIVLMSPPRDSADARTSLAALSSAVKPRTKVVIAESYGGRDEPVDVLAASLVDVGAELLAPPLRIKDLPAQSTYQLFEEEGTDLAQALTAKETLARKKAAMSSDVAKALARLSSGLYVVTAQHNNARSAMVASWVSQASFEPLGLTISVAKDRAIESLMQVGDSFVLNCLGEDSYAPLLKHFLQRFAPGADRFEGVSWFPAPETKCPVLAEGIAYMECRVVINGNVTNTAARTAVHRRKVATYY